ncbi:MAG: type II toxin-antitoxin system Phd/YefM family antitoxin [Proteobacteria bacterium]|nr:type II toxin-antitoxin system Phd/YefM family antitoxin [Pseudomonadota bacterium]
MKHVQATELKAKLAELLDEVERGQTLVVTRHGKPIARIMPDEEAAIERSREAMQRIMEAREKAPKVTVEELLQWRDDGRRY